MSIINIISNNSCELNLTVSGIYNVTLVSVSGKFNPILLDPSDYISFIKDDHEKTYDMYINNVIAKWDINMILSYLNESFIVWYEENFKSKPDKLFELDEINNLIKFPLKIKFCTPHLRSLLGILNFEKDVGDVLYSDTGSNFILIKCDKVNTPMRFSHQTLDPNSYPSIQNILSINLNIFSLSYPFQLSGNSFILHSKDLSNIKFRITDLFDCDLEFMNEILWQFQIEKIADEITD